MDPRLFYKHRGLEQAARGLEPEAALAFVQRACAACAVANTLAYAQAVEDALGQAEALAQQQALRETSANSATQVEQQMLNRYKQGLVAYTDVVTAQASALSARRALLQVSLQRQTTAVNLIAALGGGWDAPRLQRAVSGDTLH